MSLKKYLTKKNFIYFGIIITIVLVVTIPSLTSIPKKINQTTPLIPSVDTSKPVSTTSSTSTTGIEAFLKEYQFMFYHLPKTEKATALGWDKDIPLVITNDKIVNVVNNQTLKNLPVDSIALLNNQGEALIVSEKSSLVYKNTNQSETSVSEENRLSFSYLWYQKPNTHVSLSSDKKTLSLIDTTSKESTPLFASESEINPLSISIDNNQISFTDKNNLYLISPNKEPKQTKLNDTTKESLTFWLNHNLFLVEKVELPRLLDFIVLVNQEDLSFKQIITSSSIIGRLNLNIRPIVNEKQDMILFAENNGLVWILSRDQAITRIFPQLKLPAETWNSGF